MRKKVEKIKAKYIDKDWLKLEIENGAKPKKIAEICNVDVTTIYKWIRKFGIIRKKKPTEKEIEKDLQHLSHMEACIIPIFISLMFTGLTLYFSINDDFIRTNSQIMFFGSLLLSIVHIWSITLKKTAERMDAFIWDVLFFFGLIILYIASFFTRSILPLLNIKPSSDLGFIIPILIIIIGSFLSFIYLGTRVIPILEKRAFPILCKLCHQGYFNSRFFGKNPPLT